MQLPLPKRWLAQPGRGMPFASDEAFARKQYASVHFMWWRLPSRLLDGFTDKHAREETLGTTTLTKNVHAVNFKALTWVHAHFRSIRWCEN